MISDEELQRIRDGIHRSRYPSTLREVIDRLDQAEHARDHLVSMLLEIRNHATAPALVNWIDAGLREVSL